MSEEKTQSPAESTSRIPRVVTKTTLTPSEPPIAPAPEVASREKTAATGSIPPPPPSRRPVSERPQMSGTSPLPPPVSVRASLPKAPPVARVGKQHPDSADLKRLEDENQSLRKRLATQREENRVEHKNVAQLRSELAHLKTKLAAPKEAPSADGNEMDQLRATHAQEVRELKQRHQREVDELKRNQRAEIGRVKKDYEVELARRDQQAARQDKAQQEGAEKDLSTLRNELDELKRTNTTFRQANTELREKNSTLEQQLQQALEEARKAPPPAPDHLTDLKGIGPKVAQALLDAGVTKFSQIAAWTDEEIEAIAPRIKISAGRIRKNDWVGQAKNKVG